MSTDDGKLTEADALVRLRRSTELLWRGREQAPRGPKPGLTLDRIVDAAIALADAEGIDGLTMRRVAAQLGVGTMSLYRYVPGKAELLDLMFDRVSVPGDDTKKAVGWRAAMEAIARDGRKRYLRHQWLLHVNWTRPVFGPNSLRDFQLTIAALDGLGLTDRERVKIIVALDSYVAGNVRQEILYANAPAETGISEEAFWAHQIPVLERAIDSGDYPHLATLDEDAFSGTNEDDFEFGLARLLDGVEKLIASRHMY